MEDSGIDSSLVFSYLASASSIYEFVIVRRELMSNFLQMASL